MKKTLAIWTAMSLLSGCATSAANYVPPMTSKLENTKKVAKSFDSVWDQLVKELSSDFFVINNIDKNSRLINISFTSSKPSQFIDCGITTRSFNNARGPQNVTYSAADSSSFMISNKSGFPFHVDRATKLEGRANIYIAPEEGGTNVTVNTKYVLNVDMRMTNAEGRPAGHAATTADFSTKTAYEANEPNGMKCRARGTIEKKILDLAT